MDLKVVKPKQINGKAVRNAAQSEALQQAKEQAIKHKKPNQITYEITPMTTSEKISWGVCGACVVLIFLIALAKR